MGRWTTPVALLLVGGALVAGGHYYLWARLIRDVSFSPPLQRGLTTVLCSLAISIPVGVVASRFMPPRWSVWWLRPVYLWIGVAFLLVMSTAGVDLLRLGYALVNAAGADLNPDRRKVLARIGAAFATTVAMGAGGWALWNAGQIRVKRVEIPLTKLPAALDGLRIVQLSDIHVGPTIGRAFIERVVSMVNGLAPDLVAITGDLVDASVADLRQQVAPLANLTSTFGTYFVTGNHEYPVDAPQWCAHLTSLGLQVLRNEYVELERDDARLHLAGTDDHEAAHFDVGHRADIGKAVAGRDETRPLILLAHQPKAIHEAVRFGVDLQLSGHTHGGQLWPLGWLQRLGQPLVSGLARFGHTWLYVSCGTGHSGPPMRLGAPAEITTIVLRSLPDRADPTPS